MKGGKGVMREKMVRRGKENHNRGTSGRRGMSREIQNNH